MKSKQFPIKLEHDSTILEHYNDDLNSIITKNPKDLGSISQEKSPKLNTKNLDENSNQSSFSMLNKFNEDEK
jgi:hypothetical protein